MTSCSRRTSVRCLRDKSRLGPAERLTVTELVDDRAGKSPDVTALQLDGVGYTFADLARRSRAAGSGFLELGVRPGESVALFLERQYDRGMLERDLAVAAMDPARHMLSARRREQRRCRRDGRRDRRTPSRSSAVDRSSSATRGRTAPRLQAGDSGSTQSVGSGPGSNGGAGRRGCPQRLRRPVLHATRLPRGRSPYPLEPIRSCRSPGTRTAVVGRTNTQLNGSYRARARPSASGTRGPASGQV
jgi:hypothetical protein